MAKILLINPPMTQEELYSNYGVAAATMPPLGICYLAAFLEQDNHEVKIIDGIASKTTKKKLKDIILGFKPDIIGITALTVSYKRAIETAEHIKEIDGKIILVLGGPHISSIPIQAFKDEHPFDIGVIGEGEVTFLELVNYLEKNNFHNYSLNLKNINGIVYKNSLNEIIQTSSRKLIQDLDSLPLPARHLLPNISLYDNLLVSDQKPNFASMVPSRGCPFHCIYCDQNVFGHNWRIFSAKYLINEVEELVTRYNVNTIQIQDDLFTLKRERVIEFCNLLLQKEIHIKWSLASRVNLVDADLLKLMKQAGCDTIFYGIENGNQEILNKIKKGITLEEVTNAVNITNKVGLKAHGSFILGLPFDTKESMEKTIKFALSLPLEVATFHLATPYPNTSFEKIGFNYGKIHASDWSQYRGHPDEVIYTPEGISREYLIQKQKEAYRKFYLRPRLIWNRIKSLASPQFFNLFINYTKGALALLRQ